MKTILNYCREIKSSTSLLRIIFLLIVSFSITKSVVAQNVAGPFSYTPPSYNLRWSDNSSYALMSIPMNLVNALETDNGLMVKFKIHMDLVFDLPILNLIYQQDTILSFMYDENLSINVRRNMGNGNSYSYRLYDKLFDFNWEECTFLMKVYFTSHFILIAVNRIGTNDNYLSPLFFGLGDKMNSFLARSSDAIIRIGNTDFSPYYSVSNIEVCSFKYAPESGSGDPNIFLLSSLNSIFIPN